MWPIIEGVLLLIAGWGLALGLLHYKRKAVRLQKRIDELLKKLDSVSPARE